MREVVLLTRLCCPLSHCFICLATCTLLSLAAVGGVVCPNLDLMIRNELRSAYISGSSGNPGETRPMFTHLFRGPYKFGEYGRLGGYVATRSALTDQKDEYRRRAYDWFEYGVNYTYACRLANDLRLVNYANHLWSHTPGWYKRGKPLYGMIFEQSLDNPWIVPYYRFLGVYRPTQWETLKIGVRRPFSVLGEELAIVPYAEIVGGDCRRLEAKYGEAPYDSYCCFIPFATEFGAVFTYELTENIGMRLMLRNWNLIDRHARRYEKRQVGSWHVTWLPVASFAIEVKF